MLTFFSKINSRTDLFGKLESFVKNALSTIKIFLMRCTETKNSQLCWNQSHQSLSNLDTDLEIKRQLFTAKHHFKSIFISWKSGTLDVTLNIASSRLSLEVVRGNKLGLWTLCVHWRWRFSLENSLHQSHFTGFTFSRKSFFVESC